MICRTCMRFICRCEPTVMSTGIPSALWQADAMSFALVKHSQQPRKYTGELYITHLLEVASLVAEYLHHYPVEMHLPMLQVALLHDVMEDQGVTYEELVDKFGTLVADGVRYLSDLEGGNRKERNILARVRLSGAPGWVQTIKCGDLISNTKSIVANDPGFALVYLAEKRRLLQVLGIAVPAIHIRATAMAICPGCANKGFTSSWFGIRKCKCNDVYSA